MNQFQLAQDVQSGLHISNESTLTITLAAASGLLIFAIGATWWVAKTLSNITTQIRTMLTRLDNAFTIEKASEQALRMAIENPGMRVPDPRDPTKIIEVRSRDEHSHH